jgi:hypothetical protein
MTRPWVARRLHPLDQERAQRLEQGSATPELVIVLPALLLLLALLTQVVVYALAADAVTIAANEGGAVTRTLGGSTGAGAATAAAVLDGLASGLIEAPRVSGVSGVPGTSGITVTARAAALFPGLHLSLQATNIGVREELFGAAPG